jgi:hypothetical protein
MFVIFAMSLMTDVCEIHDDLDDSKVSDNLYTMMSEISTSALLNVTYELSFNEFDNSDLPLILWCPW